MMVDFDAAVAAVQDPNADPVFLAKIAYENPEFGANVVANPRAYPGLKRWVAQFGDERARQQLVAMGWPVPQDGIMQQEAETASEQAQYQMPSEQAQYQMPSEQVQYQQPQQSSEVQYQAQHQPPATQQCQPEPFAATPASNMANDASTEYVDPYTNPADLSEVADFSPIQPQEPVASNAGFTAELAMTTEDQMLMAEIASKAPELHPFLARNPHIYPDLLNWLASLNDSAINAAIRLRR
ncbi:hypothetical protein GT945_07810 [Bifidobacterium pseudocatenulatum]|jgi:hypothetical protein|uniref:Leucine rich repeat variant domain-containing protein n=4 Tax=Bifidobacterium TaxID=1678 RepID=C0BRU6_BIFPS|nr:MULTISPECIES: hypothetical protein [Bifidobacterium]HJI74709.1 hypothetical protein [Bifidobacteriaceae bacterium]EEG71390.1 hypothetical protein BIFPSEUDO_03360 [Bifidobacterium pseudocatenulatum DSM 20438 = JCM 1200 = LMG 10505]MDB6492135.1 hypothetical protein [Bifidobacterium pseudocatenulatum]MDB6494091.1 hypothetical protein [Bifidobacterium pseudocatenulatum]MDB6504535.1 hypothetical protein [Bifidobacterium pseudocatenulatum]